MPFQRDENFPQLREHYISVADAFLGNLAQFDVEIKYGHRTLTIDLRRVF